MKDEHFAQAFALASAYCGLGVAAIFMLCTVAVTTLNVGSAFLQLTPDQAAAAVLAAPIVTPVPQAQAQAVPAVCSIERTLSLGASGSSVACLQQILAQDPSIYPEGKVTGYFGALTQKAVQRWQAAHGITSSGDANSTGYGIVGPKTRSAILGVPTGVTTNPTVTTTATSTTGTGTNQGACSAPRFNLDNLSPARVGTAWKAQILVYTGVSPKVKVTGLPFGFVLSDSGSSWSISGTATTTGTYDISLSAQNDCGGASGGITLPVIAAGSQCPVYMPPACSGGTLQWRGQDSAGCDLGYRCSTVTSTQVCPVYQISICPTGTHRVDGTPTYDSNNCPVPHPSCVTDTTTTSVSFSASPTSGTAPLSVQFAAGNLGTDTSGYSVSFGDGSANSSGSCSPNSSTGACLQGGLFFNHTYAVAGTYAAQLVYQPPFVCNAPPGAACAQVMPPSKLVGTATITVTASQLKAGSSGVQNFDPAGLTAAVVAAPFNLMVDSLTNIFVMFGVGQ